MNLREAQQAKIDAATQQTANLTQELNANVDKFGDWLDQDPESFKVKMSAFAAELAKHIPNQS